MIGTSATQTREKGIHGQKRPSGHERHTSVHFVDCSMIGMTGSGASILFRLVFESRAAWRLVCCAAWEGLVVRARSFRSLGVCGTRQRGGKDEDLRKQYLVTTVADVHAQKHVHPTL
ncbi:hypothetical protein PV04_07531 [Phialophora macrospora]|uniref:Uncharacterized protein n=1 Tax=Phialophora macrospora TaxID=1851006 RepID=A0A0D2FB62_9EURO|nr:hypothetical protein PV04_07531 [Phialophora macrospora]